MLMRYVRSCQERGAPLRGDAAAADVAAVSGWSVGCLPVWLRISVFGLAAGRLGGLRDRIVSCEAEFGGAPVPGDGAFAGGGGGGVLKAGAAGGAFVPPGVVEVGDGVAQLLADGAGVAADELADGHGVDADGAGDAGRAVAHHVQGAQPQPGPARVQPGPRQGPTGHRNYGGGGAGLWSPAARGHAADRGRG